MRQTLFLCDFTVLDFAYLSPEEGLQGESFFVSAELEGELDAQGFLFDFGPAKKTLKAVVDASLDHKLLVPALSPFLQGTPKGFSFNGLEYEAPAEAVVLLEGTSITAQLLEASLREEALSQLPPNISGLRFLLREEPRFLEEPNFRYTHGLRLHQGNCQRLLHGHRNPVEVFAEGKRLRKAEEILAAEWSGAHFTFAPTLANRRELDLPLGQRQAEHPGWAIVEYGAPQGAFRAKIPASRIVLLEAEPSIENIARLGAERLRSLGFREEIRVVAYEGLNKGASFTLPRT